MAKPDKSHFTALDCIWKYLIRYLDLGLYYLDGEFIGLLGYSDLDQANCLFNRRSITGYYFQYNRNLISQNSTLQYTVALSTCEAEYMALREAIKEAIYLSSILNQLKKEPKLGSFLLSIPPILTDSESARKLGENPEFHKRSKHIDITYHFIRECISEKRVKLAFVRTIEQLADGFTKGLNKSKHDFFIEGLNLRKPESSQV